MKLEVRSEYCKNEYHQSFTGVPVTNVILGENIARKKVFFCLVSI